LKVYFLSTPRQPQSRHLYRLARRVAFTVVSNIFRALLRLIVPTLPQEGHFVVSGNVLKNIFNCTIIKIN
jgi:hypothetical protein